MATRVRRFALKTSERAPMKGAVALGRADADARLSVTLKLRRKQPIDLASSGKR